jgi:uncharacterized membrane protein YcjF (UPF0283 family)
MTPGKSAIKFMFGLIIFLFSLALVYFTADYVDQGNIFDYWMTLFISSVAFIVIGIIVYHILPVSLGFLFAADVLILHLIIENI